MFYILTKSGCIFTRHIFLNGCKNNTVLYTFNFYISGIIFHVACNFSSFSSVCFWELSMLIHIALIQIFHWCIYYINLYQYSFHARVSLGYTPKSEIVGYMYTHLTLLDMAKLLSTEVLIYSSTSRVWKFPLCHILIDAWYCCQYQL